MEISEFIFEKREMDLVVEILTPIQYNFIP